ncbi:hypothetical protein [Rhodoferax sp.]|uniref:hypothetical protein n=1 Tax=Rhodoferax sp. TaxID=50421 RepID=UPI00374DB14F
MHTATKAGAGVLLTLALSLPLATVARAGPSDYIYNPIVEEGEKEVDLKFGTANARDGTRESALSLGLGFGVNSWWFTEVYVKGNRQTPDGWRFDAIEWENKFQLTETGKYPVDVGLVVEIERPQDRSEGWELRFGPLFQMELTPKVVANVNLLFGRHYNAATPSSMSMDYQWQLKYRWKPEFEVGAQGLGSLGPWREWLPSDQQEHKAGPAVFGKIRLDGRRALNYNAAWLLGHNTNTANNTVRVQVEYEY